MAYTALLDACVLYPNMLRDLLLRLAVTDLYRAKWSADIHDEWMRSLAANRPDIPPEHITRVRNLMDENVRDALVEDYASLVPGLTLPDPKDRHVLAAAIVGRADVIVTFNLRDFPADTLSPFGIEAQHPDEFMRHQFDLAPDLGLRGRARTSHRPQESAALSRRISRHPREARPHRLRRGTPLEDGRNLTTAISDRWGRPSIRGLCKSTRVPRIVLNQPAPPLKYVHPSPHSSTR